MYTLFFVCLPQMTADDQVPSKKKTRLGREVCRGLGTPDSNPGSTTFYSGTLPFNQSILHTGGNLLFVI
jgi:hypothetical protein